MMKKWNRLLALGLSLTLLAACTPKKADPTRSEEHTSELQSHAY